ncbi:hypothetical protein [Salana multivorans]
MSVLHTPPNPGRAHLGEVRAELAEQDVVRGEPELRALYCGVAHTAGFEDPAPAFDVLKADVGRRWVEPRRVDAAPLYYCDIA